MQRVGSVGEGFLELPVDAQPGLYTDFDPVSGSWTPPADVSQASFDQIRPLVGGHVAETQRQLDEFTSFRSAASSPAGAP